MADIEPNERPPGFNVVEPGFRVFDDGSVVTYGSDLGRPFFSNLKEAAAWVNAAVNGAYSVLPGAYNAGRSVARGTGPMSADPAGHRWNGGALDLLRDRRIHLAVPLSRGAGLDVFWKTPLRKTISTALMLGTIVPLLVVFPMLYRARQP